MMIAGQYVNDVVGFLDALDVLEKKVEAEAMDTAYQLFDDLEATATSGATCRETACEFFAAHAALATGTAVLKHRLDLGFAVPAVMRAAHAAVLRDGMRAHLPA